MRAIPVILLTMLLPATTCRADEPRPNETIVASGDDGSCYAKSIPADFTSQRGTTTIYNVEKSKDVPTATYNWYSLRIHLSCNIWRNGRSETTVVRVGPWNDGHRANKNDLAIAFYLNGKLLKKYSTLDISGKPTNVSGSVSHYTVFSSIDGFQRQGHGRLDFIATRVDGVQMRFSSDTGQMIRAEP